jgi:FAD/FMN-containing dehydrogenase
MTVPVQLLDRIRAAVDPAGWIGPGPDMAPYVAEERSLWQSASPLVVRPKSTEEVAAVVRLCADAGVAIVPQGGNTGLVGGAVARDEIVLSLGRMNRIRAIDPANHTLTAEAGCVLASVQKAADEQDCLFPLSLGAEGTCQIGGNLSTNAGGVQVLRYGNARDLTLGLEVVLADGRIWDGLRGLRKDNTGYDLKQVFIGAEGTLGIITAAVLKLFPKPRDRATAMAGVGSLTAALDLFQRVRGRAGDSLTACELLDRRSVDFVLRHIPGTKSPCRQRHAFYVLIELTNASVDGGLTSVAEEVLAKAIEDGLVEDAVIAASAQQARDLWRLRETIPEAQKHEGGSVKHDIAVPISRVADYIDAATAAVEKLIPGIRPVAFGHLGDGNIHFNISQPAGMAAADFLARRHDINRIVHDLAIEANGSFSAEHGVGLLKKEELERYKGGIETDLMRILKRALDPTNIMNPGKVV